MFESLERRKYLDASIVGDNLVIMGSAGDDTILVTLEAANVRVVIEPEGFNETFALADFSGVIGVLAGDGNDFVSISHDITMRNADIRGEGGNDTLLGGGGNDTMFGGFGDDFLDGGPGADTFIGDAGFDTASYEGRTNPISVTFDGEANDGEEGEGDFISDDIQMIIGGAGNDFISFEGASSEFRVAYGRHGDDTLVGGAGGHRLHGGPGDDMITGGPDNDTILGHFGQDVMDGGPGGVNTVTYYYAGSSVFATPNGEPVSGTAREQDTIMPNIQNLIGSEFDDELVGSESDNFIKGLGGNDTIHAGGGMNTLFGGNGDDFFFAQNGNVDVVDGGNGDDDGEFDEFDIVTNVGSP